jgi:hypothetical protein
MRPGPCARRSALRGSSCSTHLLADRLPQLRLLGVELAAKPSRGLRRDEFKDRIAAEFTADLGHHHQSVRLTLADAKAGNVVLHVSLVVIAVFGIIELSAAVRYRSPVAPRCWRVLGDLEALTRDDVAGGGTAVAREVAYVEICIPFMGF